MVLPVLQSPPVSPPPCALLSEPSKMPTLTFNIPAGRFCPGGIKSVALHGKEAVCWGCYAMGGNAMPKAVTSRFGAKFRRGTNYCRPNVRTALDARADFVLRSLRTDGGDSFVRSMVETIGRSRTVKRTGLFRVHDSGDLFSNAYVRAWIRICRELPSIRFWFPTREHIMPGRMPALLELAALPNVSVRPSALRKNEPAPAVPGLAAGTSVYDRPADARREGQRVCPATRPGNVPTCAANNCTRCWDKGGSICYVNH
jgi:hypothetical protein